MGNIHKRSSKKPVAGGRKNNHSSVASLPKIQVIGASPPHTEAGETVFIIPEFVCLKEQNQSFGHVNESLNTTTSKNQPGNDHYKDARGVFSSAQGPRGFESNAKSHERDCEFAAERGLHLAQLTLKRRRSKGSQRSFQSKNASERGTGEGQFDAASITGSDRGSPKGSRKNFIEYMINSSPQVRQSMRLRDSRHLSVRHKERNSGRSDSDSASLLSYAEEDGGSLTLDPLEHEWMMCASDGQWESLLRLLKYDPYLLAQKDFVTGFTCLHWAAKQGRQDLLALLVNFAKQHAVVVNINAPSSSGYTPLHLAVMHRHFEVVKFLVRACNADVEARDFSGKRASQYLSSRAPDDIGDIIGGEGGVCGWKEPKVVYSNIQPRNRPEHDTSDGGSVAPSVCRKSSFNVIRPGLFRLKEKTKIRHSSSFTQSDDRERAPTSTTKSRRKSNLFG